MNRDEIKNMYSMRDIVARYGYVPNRAGFISCPFHSGDRSPSLKIYNDSFHCFGCGAHGDIFVFEQLMNGMTFRQAYESLGGTYERNGGRMSFSTMRKIDKAKRERERKAKQERQKKQRRDKLGMMIDAYRNVMEQSVPYSDAWCYCQPKLEYLLYAYEKMEGGEATRGSWRIQSGRVN